jgi:ATP/maltotriose-dependent transcriptional regulator MalT
MARWDVPERHGAREPWSLHASVRLEAFESAERPSGPIASLRDDIAPAPPWTYKLEAPPLEILWRCKTKQNLTGASLPRIRRGLARAWRLMLSLRTREALDTIDQVDLQLDDVATEAAKRLRVATQLLRAVSLALQDDSLAALAIAMPHLGENITTRDCYAASTLCRLGFWRLGRFDSFHALPRQQPRVRWSTSRALSAMFDLSIEAAVALDHLNLPTAKRLAADASVMAERAKATPGLAALPACLTAQVLYEEGSLGEAEDMLRDRLPAINAEGSIECALRAYLVLTRIARQRMQFDLAAILLREAQVLGERRLWPRLVAASMAERVSLLLAAEQVQEARLSVEHLDRYAETHRAGSGHAAAEIAQYRTLARWRVAWAEAPSREAVAAFRQLYHCMVERRDLYAGCRLAVELTGMLASIGEVEEAGALFLHTLKSGAVAGLYQVFLEKGQGSGALLLRAYDRVDATDSADREFLPFVGSLLSQWEGGHPERSPVQSTSTISDALTARERDILGRISQGLPNKRIARLLDISPETVKSHIKRIFLKLAVGTRIEAISRGKSLGLL